MAGHDIYFPEVFIKDGNIVCRWEKVFYIECVLP